MRISTRRYNRDYYVYIEIGCKRYYIIENKLGRFEGFYSGNVHDIELLEGYRFKRYEK